MIFPILDLEKVVQEHDKTRLDASQSYGSGSTITKIEIRPTAAGSWVVVTTQKYLDWQYTMTDPVNDPEEDFTVSVRINDTEVVSKTITVVSAAKDNLFSTDPELVEREPDIMKYVPRGRASFKSVHRAAQKEILDYLNKEAFVNDNRRPFTADDLISTTDVSKWSLFIALRLIMEGVSNAVDDVFALKAKKYGDKELFYRNRAIVRLDTNGDGTADLTEALDVRTCRVMRR